MYGNLCPCCLFWVESSVSQLVPVEAKLSSCILLCSRNSAESENNSHFTLPSFSQEDLMQLFLQIFLTGVLGIKLAWNTKGCCFINWEDIATGSCLLGIHYSFQPRLNHLKVAFSWHQQGQKRLMGAMQICSMALNLSNHSSILIRERTETFKMAEASWEHHRNVPEQLQSITRARLSLQTGTT